MERGSCWVYKWLAPESKQFGEKRKKKRSFCSVPIADVVLFEEEEQGSKRRKATQWIFSSAEDGRVNSRTHISWSKVRERFLQLGGNDAVCCIHMTNGTRHKLDKTTFLALIAGAKRDGGLASVEMLQAMVNAQGEDTQIRCRTTYSREFGSGTCILNGKPSGSMLELETNLDGLTRDLVDTVEKASGTQVFSMDIQFVQDAQGIFRVANLSNVWTSAGKGEVISTTEQEIPQGPASPRDEESKREEGGTHGKARKGQKRGKKLAKTASAPSLPSLKSRTPKNTKSRAAAKFNSETKLQVSKCKGDFCGLVVDRSEDPLSILDLDSISSDTQSKSSGSMEEATPAKELERVRATSSSQLVRKRKLLASGGETKSARDAGKEKLHTVEQKTILLARNEMHFITGAVRQTDSNLRDDAEFAAAWKEIDARLQGELGLKHADEFYHDTTVCSDCFAIYSKLEALRGNAFQANAVKVNVTNQSREEGQQQETQSSSLKPQQSNPGHETEQDSSKSNAESPTKTKRQGSSKAPRQDAKTIPTSTTPSPKTKKKQVNGGEQFPTPSIAETEFLLRHADTMKLEQEKKRLERERGEQEAELAKLRHVHATQTQEIEKLQDKLLEVSTSLESKSEGFEKLRDELKASKEDLTKSQREFLKAMKEKEDEIERLSLEIEQIKHDALASRSQNDNEASLAAKVSEGLRHRGELQQTIRELNDRIVELNGEIRRLRSQADEAVKDASKQAKAKLGEQLSTLKSGMDKLASENDAKQVVIRDLEYNLEMSKMRETDLKRQLSQAGNEKARLQEELAAASQSLKSITSIGSSEDAAIHAVRAAAEAKVARMKNELAYIQSQAKAESENVLVLKESLAKQQEHLNTLMAQHKSDLAKMEMNHKAEIKDREATFEKELEIPRSQIALLEEKVGALQANLAKMHTEMDVTRRKLALSEQDQRRAKAQATRLEQEKEELERNLAELQGTLSAASSSSSTSSSPEKGENGASVSSTPERSEAAELRRLENHVAYLQKQLDIETGLKSELDQAVSQTQMQLKKCNESWKLDVQAKQAELRQLEEEFREKEATFRQENLEAQGQVSNLLKQVEEMKSAYGKVKDQLRMDQEALQSAHQRIEDLKQELESSRNLAASLDGEAAKATEGYRKTLSTLERRLKDTENQHAKEVNMLKIKLGEAHKQVSETNRSMLAMKDSVQLGERSASRNLGASRLWAVFSRKQHLDKVRAMEKLIANARAESALQRMVDDMAEVSLQHREEMTAHFQRVKAEAEQAKLAYAKEQVEVIQQDFEKRLSEMEVLAREDTAALLVREEGKHLQKLEKALEEQRALFDANLRDAVHEGELKTKKLQAALSAEKQTILKRAEHEKIAALEAVTKELEEKHQTEIEHLRVSHDAELRRLKTQRDEEYHLLKNALLEDKDKALKSYMETSKQDYACALQSLEAEKKEALSALQKELALKHDKDMIEALAKTSQMHQDALEELQQRLEQQSATKLAQLEAQHKEQVEEVRKVLEQKLEENLHSKDIEQEKRLQNVHKEWERKLNTECSRLLKDSQDQLEKLRVEAREEKATALKLSTEKWQKVLEECSADAMKEQEKLVRIAAEDRQKLEQALKAKYEAELVDRDKAAIKAQNVALERVKQESKKNLERLRDSLEKDFNEKLRVKLEEARAKEETELVRIEGEKQRSLQVARKQAKEELERALEKAEAEKQRALQACAKEAASHLANEVKKVRVEEKERFEAVLAQMEQEREQSEQQILQECERVTERKLAEANQVLSDAVVQAREDTERRLMKEIERLRREKEDLMQMAEERMEAIRAERNKLESSVEESKELLEEAEDMNFDLQNKVNRLNKAVVAQTMWRRLDKAKAVSAFCKFRAKLEQKMDEKIATSQAPLQGQVEKLERQVARADEKLSAYEARSKSIREILTNYKRSELMQTKVETAVIQDELGKLHTSKRELEKQESELNRELAQLEGQIREVEARMQEMSKVSAIQDGKINVSHAKKKRILDQEFEHLLDRAAHRKEQLDMVGRKIAEIEQDTQDKESGLKELESRLVQILVEQQKQLLQTIS